MATERATAEPTELRIGELAKRTGLTVRALHHYDELGLLEPSERTFAGHRLYSEAEVRRLYRIVALRELGLSLAEVGELLDRDDANPLALVRRHLAEVDRRLEAERDLRTRLEQIESTLERLEQPTVADYVNAIERMTTMQQHYTPEQLDYLAKRREELGDDAIHEVEDEWPRLYGEARELMNAGAEPSDPEMQRIAARMRELIAMFHGGDEGVKRAQAEVWKQTPREEMVAQLEAQGVADAESRIPEPELTEFIERAHTASGEPC